LADLLDHARIQRFAEALLKAGTNVADLIQLASESSASSNLGNETDQEGHRTTFRIGRQDGFEECPGHIRADDLRRFQTDQNGVLTFVIDLPPIDAHAALPGVEKTVLCLYVAFESGSLVDASAFIDTYFAYSDELYTYLATQEFALQKGACYRWNHGASTWRPFWLRVSKLSTGVVEWEQQIGLPIEQPSSIPDEKKLVSAESANLHLSILAIVNELYLLAKEKDVNPNVNAKK